MPRHETERNAVIRQRLLSGEGELWIGALSFEERCTGGLSELAEWGVKLRHGRVLSYPHNGRYSRQVLAQKEKNRSKINFLAEQIFTDSFNTVEIEAYSYQEISRYLRSGFVVNGSNLTILDISCLTKIHTLALAHFLAERRNRNWAISYSMPENYARPVSTGLPCWKDVIVAPLAESGRFSNEAYSRGIIIPGHESDRLIVALAELEPSRGLILFAETEARPDLREVSERANRHMLRQLTRRGQDRWITLGVPITDTNELSKYISSEIEAAKERSAPIILFPFGPKPVIFSIALQLAAEYSESSWFVYPIPFGYENGYSEGIDSVKWLRLEPSPYMAPLLA